MSRNTLSQNGYGHFDQTVREISYQMAREISYQMAQEGRLPGGGLRPPRPPGPGASSTNGGGPEMGWRWLSAAAPPLRGSL